MSPLHLLYIFLVMASLAPIQAVVYQVINNATGQTLQFATDFKWQTFKQGDQGDRKNYEEVIK
ncbi:hypothetical protein P3X46_013798 [Hevea brasiliensis]|uniref:Uncharacterized protein n=1 Tax=Hevea brasiliensis TaxID=3981 RepID=A0ABQ9M8I8_HEVBR|nr:hypothetical protein P3X46_013798 [Hevea brasiliensis]